MQTKPKIRLSKSENVMSTPKKENREAILKPDTESKMKKEFLVERNPKKQKVSPSIIKQVNKLHSCILPTTFIKSITHVLVNMIKSIPINNCNEN